MTSSGFVNSAPATAEDRISVALNSAGFGAGVRTWLVPAIVAMGDETSQRSELPEWQLRRLRGENSDDESAILAFIAERSVDNGRDSVAVLASKALAKIGQLVSISPAWSAR